MPTNGVMASRSTEIFEFGSLSPSGWSSIAAQSLIYDYQFSEETKSWLEKDCTAHLQKIIYSCIILVNYLNNLGDEMIQDLLLKAIKHERMLQKLTELNTYFYNRKHESQIRDELAVIINQISSVIAVSEHPKLKTGAIDLSLYERPVSRCEDTCCIATIELKHHYPKDLLHEQVQRDIMSDLSRVVVSPTTHFIHVIQQRDILTPPLIGRVKFLERDAQDVSLYVRALEGLESFPRYFKRDTVCIEVHGNLMSTYTFNIYTLSGEKVTSADMQGYVDHGFTDS